MPRATPCPRYTSDRPGVRIHDRIEPVRGRAQATGQASADITATLRASDSHGTALALDVGLSAPVGLEPDDRGPDGCGVEHVGSLFRVIAGTVPIAEVTLRASDSHAPRSNTWSVAINIGRE